MEVQNVEKRLALSNYLIQKILFVLEEMKSKEIFESLL